MIKRYKNIRLKRIARVRSKIYGTSQRPRLRVFRSNRYIYGQIIDDDKAHILVASGGSKDTDTSGKKKVEQSFLIGQTLAKRAIGKGIKKVVFDRNGYSYHGRVKALAEGAKKGGLVL